MNETNPKILWDRCLAFIKDNIDASAYKMWFMPIKGYSYIDNVLTITVPSPFFYEYLEEKYLEVIRTAIFKEIGKDTKLVYKVMLDQSSLQTVELESTSKSNIPQAQVQTKQIPEPFGHNLDPHLNPEYNFDTFIEGYSNKLSRSVAEAVAQNPAKTFNPLFIYGESGVGKTHLTNAIGTKIKELYPEKRVLYISANLFQVQFTDSILKNKSNEFMRFYQTIDVLIIDDIQELIGATKTQNTFFHVFNHLKQNGKQIIITSDRSPSDLQGMENRLITRCKWGMVAELEKPNIELRKSILRSKIKKDGLVFPEDVIDFIAENVGDSVRDLEGIVISMMAHSTVFNREINMDLAQIVLKKVVKKEKKEINIDTILNTVCDHYNLNVAEIKAKSRKKEVVQPRQIAMYLADQYTDLPSGKIGILIGGKDRTTVLYACKTVQQQLEVDKSFQNEISILRQKLQQ